MRKVVFSIVLTMAVVVTIAAGTFAEEAKPPALSSIEEIKGALGLSVYVQGGYTYNFEDPDSQTNDLRVFDHEANSFTVDLAQLVLAKDASVGGVGYKLKLSAGETAKFRFGKFVTMHGAEVIEAKDNMNYSRGLLFDFAIPFTHTGLMIGYPVSDKVSATFYVVNGWDNFDDEGSSKTLGLSIGVTPVEQLSAIVNLMNGREVDLQTGVNSNRSLIDVVSTIRPVKNLALVVNADYGVQSDSAPDGDDAKWYGVAAMGKYDFSDLFSLALRAEYFKDDDGARTLTEQAVKEITVTPEFRIAKNLLVRPEYRHDWSDEKVFDSGSKKSQDTIALGVMYTW
jgi:hypothetical protein